MAISQPTLYFIFENNGILYSTTSFASIMISVIPSMSILPEFQFDIDDNITPPTATKAKITCL